VTDFYTRLEEQLAHAGRRRSDRGPLRRTLAGRRPQVLIACAIVAMVIAVVSLLPPVLSPSDGGPGTPVPKPLPANRTDLKGIGVAIYNGTTTAGIARDVATRLERHGAIVVEVGDAVDQTVRRTQVHYRHDRRRQARAVADALGIGLLVKDPSNPTTPPVVVVVGSDYADRLGAP